jgi:hypothetical protein
VSAFLGFMKPFYKDALAVAAFAAAFLLSFILDINSIYLIIGGIVFGVALGFLRIKKSDNAKNGGAAP